MEYEVRFVGYAAFVVTRKEDLHACLDFVTGCTRLFVRGGYVSTPSGRELSRFIAKLPTHLDELNNKLRQNAARRTSGDAEWNFGENEISLDAGFDPAKVIRRFEARLRQIEPVLEQAENIGLQIVRRPYVEFIDEINKTGIAGIEFHGIGVFSKGKLTFHPSTFTYFVKGTENKRKLELYLDYPK
jgi:hypothetical protein